MAIVAACLCWGIDNNLIREVPAGASLQVAGVKGLVAGMVNLAIGVAIGGVVPATGTVLLTDMVGFCSYGLIQVLSVLALRHLGAARTVEYEI
jgi:drug/metabolite transporter (DMT)-like permease